MTLFDAAYALDELAAGRSPDRARVAAGARALDRVRVEAVAGDRDLLTAANELHLAASGAAVDPARRGPARAAALAEAVRRLSDG